MEKALEFLAGVSAHASFPNIDFSEFGRLIKFHYHYDADYPLYAVVSKVYANYIQATCLNWYPDSNYPFERPFYISHMVGDVVDCATGEIFSPRSFYERYVTLYHPERKFGDMLPGHAHSKPQICFTGFAKQRKAELKALASAADLWVTEEVRLHLEYLVCGANAGPSKMAKAQKLGAAIWSEAEFLEWLDKQ